jgi:rhamnosyl/mannosyltransferase
VSGTGGLHDALLGAGVDSRVMRMSSWRSFGRIVDRSVDAIRLLRVARGLDVGIVHAHDVWRAGYARFIARRLSIPFVVHVRGPLSQRDIGKHRLYLADRVIAIAQRYADDLLKAGIERDKIALIDDGVDLHLFDAAQGDPGYVRNRFGVHGQWLIGMVGRLSPEKHVLEFIAAAARLPPCVRSSVQLVFAGDWDSPGFRGRVASDVRRLGLDSHVHFLGRCPSDLMPKLLSSLDVLVTMSGGSVMFEAMAMEKPVLSIRADGRHSLHTRHSLNAWCVDNDNPEAIAGALSHLLLDENLRRSLGRAGRTWIGNNLSSTSMVAKVRDLYGSLGVAANVRVD